MGFLALGVAGAVLITPERRFLRNIWLWVGVGISIQFFLPNLIWQWQHQFISLEFLSYLHARDSGQGRYNGFFPEQFLVCVNPVTVPFDSYGALFYLVDKNNKRYCLLGWVFCHNLHSFFISPSAFLLWRLRYTQC